MKITVMGAGGGEVTGSAYLLEAASANVLVDCGFFQGARKLENDNRIPANGAMKRLHAVVLTHAHLDHTGRLPLLTKAGYEGPVYGTAATFDLADLILRDCAYLHKADVERDNRRRERRGQPLLDVLFIDKDVARLRPLYRRFRYDTPTEVAPGVVIRMVDAGHILGSASVEMTIEEGGRKRVVVFSGDLGPRDAPLHRDPTPLERADLLFIEATYGDRDHRSLEETAIEGREIIARAVENKAKILVPAFAIGRTQLLLYLLAGAFKRKTLPPFPIYVDSPMAIEATYVYRRHAELFDDEALAMKKFGELQSHPRSARPCPTAADSRRLNHVRGPCVIMAGAGMCTGGRILHHLRENLPKPETAVLIVGFQSQGTLGRALVDGKKLVTVQGQRIPVRASKPDDGRTQRARGAARWSAGSTRSPTRGRASFSRAARTGPATRFVAIADRHQLKAECPALGEVIHF